MKYSYLIPSCKKHHECATKSLGYLHFLLRWWKPIPQRGYKNVFQYMKDRKRNKKYNNRGECYKKISEDPYVYKVKEHQIHHICYKVLKVLLAKEYMEMLEKTLSTNMIEKS